MIDSVALQEKQKLEDYLSADMFYSIGEPSSNSGNARKSIIFYSIGWTRPTPSMALYMWGKHTASEV